MDIRKFAVEATSRLVLRDANDEAMTDDGKEAAVNVYGPGSKQFAKAQSLQNNRFVARLKKKGSADQSADQKTAEQAEFLADITESFENVEVDGLKGRALALAIYSDVSIGFISDQVAKHIGDWANFTKGSAKS